MMKLNYHEQQLAINDATKSINYLREELNKTSVVELQQAIYRLLEKAQTKKIMLANVRDQYAFSVIDSAKVPETQESRQSQSEC